MRPDDAVHERPDRKKHPCRKPFTILGAAIALGLIGFSPEDPGEMEPVEQRQDDVQPITKGLRHVALARSGEIAEAFRMSRDPAVVWTREQWPDTDSG